MSFFSRKASDEFHSWKTTPVVRPGTEWLKAPVVVFSTHLLFSSVIRPMSHPNRHTACVEREFSFFCSAPPPTKWYTKLFPFLSLFSWHVSHRASWIKIWISCLSITFAALLYWFCNLSSRWATRENEAKFRHIFPYARHLARNFLSFTPKLSAKLFPSRSELNFLSVDEESITISMRKKREP